MSGLGFKVQGKEWTWQGMKVKRVGNESIPGHGCGAQGRRTWKCRCTLPDTPPGVLSVFRFRLEMVRRLKKAKRSRKHTPPGVGSVWMFCLKNEGMSTYLCRLKNTRWCMTLGRRPLSILCSHGASQSKAGKWSRGGLLLLLLYYSHA